MKFLLSLIFTTATLYAPQSLANTRVEKMGQPKRDLPLLDKAWKLRSEALPKRLSFTETLLKELETRSHTVENRSRMVLANALVMLGDEKTRIAAAEILTQAGKAAPLKITRVAAQVIWDEFKKKIPTDTSLGQSALSDVAQTLYEALRAELDPEHTYYLAQWNNTAGNTQTTLEQLTRIESSSKFYRIAKLQEGLILASMGKTARASKALETVISIDTTEAEKKADVSESTLVELKEKAVLNLARIYFENKEFKESLTLYRSIDAQSPLFYESLSEQGWAFFMAGHPNRALGVGYGATSPHFNQQFQPDQYFLNAAVNYWLCDFKAARNTIQSFLAHTRSDAKMLQRWINESAPGTNIASSEKIKMAYQVVESLAQGVKHTNNLLGPRSLQSLGRKRSLMQGISEIEKLRSERLRLVNSTWPLRSKKLVADALLQREEKERIRIGRIALSMIQTMRSEYEQTLAQMRLLHLEIMTAEKDALTKSGRSAEGQQFLGTEPEFLEGGSENARLWQDNKREYWKDELDSFVFNKKSQCNTEEERHNAKE